MNSFTVPYPCETLLEMCRCWGSLAASIIAMTGVVHADGDTPDDNAIQLHGFVSQGALLTTDNNYLAQTERGSLEFTEAAV